MSLHSELQSIDGDILVTVSDAMIDKLGTEEGAAMLVSSAMEDVPAFDKLGEHLTRIFKEDFPPAMASMAMLGAGVVLAVMREYAVTQEMDAQFPGLSS